MRLLFQTNAKRGLHGKGACRPAVTGRRYPSGRRARHTCSMSARSQKGRSRPPTRWWVSQPCPQTAPCRRAGPCAPRPEWPRTGPECRRRGAPGAMWPAISCRMAMGSSLPGSSLVSTLKSAPALAALASSSRRSWVRPPTEPNTQMSCRGRRPAGRSACWKAPARCGRNPPQRCGRAAPGTTSSRPGTWVQARAAAACPGVTPKVPANAVAHRALETLNAPEGAAAWG